MNSYKGFANRETFYVAVGYFDGVTTEDITGEGEGDALWWECRDFFEAILRGYSNGPATDIIDWEGVADYLNYARPS